MGGDWKHRSTGKKENNSSKLGGRLGRHMRIRGSDGGRLIINLCWERRFSLLCVWGPGVEWIAQDRVEKSGVAIVGFVNEASTEVKDPNCVKALIP